MTEPTDAEILELASQYWHCLDETESATEIELVRAALAKWGQPAQAAEPVAPDFFTVCAWYEGGGKADWIPLPGYSNETEHGVKNLVLEAARKEGYKGTAAGRLLDLGWEIRPVYLTPQPVAREPLTPEQIATAGEIEDNDSAFLAGFSTGARFAEQYHGIKGGQS